MGESYPLWAVRTGYWTRGFALFFNVRNFLTVAPGKSPNELAFLGHKGPKGGPFPSGHLAFPLKGFSFMKGLQSRLGLSQLLPNFG